MCPATTPSRWCPTPEQVMILEEIYRNGLKTPNATQIQHITSHLSLYGKIEGKNVFYWFQNHKARDRQKLRRKLYKQLQLQLQQQMLAKHHRFNDHQYFHFLHHHQQLEFSGCFHERAQREGEEASTAAKVDTRTWLWHDRLIMTTENDEASDTTCRGGTPRTLELFPVRASCMKEEESASGSGIGSWMK